MKYEVQQQYTQNSEYFFVEINRTPLRCDGHLLIVVPGMDSGKTHLHRQENIKCLTPLEPQSRFGNKLLEI